MHKSNQQVTVTYTVEGPDNEGLFLVDDGFAPYTYAEDTGNPNVCQAIRLHLAFAPVDPVEIDGYLVRPRADWNDVAAWEKGADPENIARGYYPHVVAIDVDNAVDHAIIHAAEYTPAYKALIKYFIRKKEGTL